MSGAVGGEFAEGCAEAGFDLALLALLLVAEALELGGCVVGESAVGEDFALDGFCERGHGCVERGGQLGEAGEAADEARGGRLEERLPGGDVISEAGDGLELGGFEGCAAYLGFGREGCGVEEAAEGDGDLLGEEEDELGGKAMLAGDPVGVGGGEEGEDGFAADGGGGVAGDVREKLAPLESFEVSVSDGRRDGGDERHLFNGSSCEWFPIWWEGCGESLHGASAAA